MHALAKQALTRQALAKQAHALGGLNVEENFFHTTWLHFIGDLHHVNIIMDFGKTSLKAQKSPYLHKRRQSPWFKLKLKLIAHHLIFCLMIYAHESD